MYFLGPEIKAHCLLYLLGLSQMMSPLIRVFHFQVRGKKLHHFTGSYKKFLDQRKERDAQLTAQAQAQADEIARLQVFVDRFGAKVGVLGDKLQ